MEGGLVTLYLIVFKKLTPCESRNSNEQPACLWHLGGVGGVFGVSLGGFWGCLGGVFGGGLWGVAGRFWETIFALISPRLYFLSGVFGGCWRGLGGGL